MDISDREIDNSFDSEDLEAGAPLGIEPDVALPSYRSQGHEFRAAKHSSSRSSLDHGHAKATRSGGDSDDSPFTSSATLPDEYDQLYHGKRSKRIIDSDRPDISLEGVSPHLLALRRHVKLAVSVVEKSLGGRSAQQKCSIVLSYLDGYISWLPAKERLPFRERVLRYQSSDPAISEQSEPPEFFLRVWRVLWSITEQAAHSANRLAQLFHREMKMIDRSAVTQLCRHPHTSLSVLLFTDADLAIYHDGLKAIEAGTLNFDDLDELCSPVPADEPVSSSVTDQPKPEQKQVASKNKWRKTFQEAEGMSAFVVGLRNYFSMFHYNAFVAILAWYWMAPKEVPLVDFVWLDASASAATVLFDIFARLLTYGGRNLCGYRLLPYRQLFPMVVLYLIFLAYVPIIYFMEDIVSTYALPILGGIFLLRLANNCLLYFGFPRVEKGHWKGDPTLASHRWLDALKLVCFFILLTGLLLPAHYFFIVPTLQRSAFWDFCEGFFETQRIQCYIGVAGLWVPLISIILIINYIAYTIVLALYGALVANYKRVGTSSDESYSTIKGFRLLSMLLGGWRASIPPKSSSFAKIPVEIRLNPYVDLSSELPLSTSQVEEDMQKVNKIWYHIVDDLRECDLINSSAATKLYLAHNLHDVVLHRRAREILFFFFSSIVGLPNEKVKQLAASPNFLDNLPSLTQLIPSYGEAVVFDRAYLCNSDNKKASNLVFLTLKHPAEWENLYERMQQVFGDKLVPKSSQDMLSMFTADDSTLPDDLIDEIRIWASMRGQTLFRTVRGSMTYRMALRLLFENTNRQSSVAADRAQIILAHQQYGDPSVLRKIGADIKLMMRKLSVPHFVGTSAYGATPFDLVFDWSVREIDKHESNRDELERRKQQNSAESDRLAIRLIHREVEEICEYGNALKKLIDSKCDAGLLHRTGPFKFASVKAGLPRSIRLPLAFVFHHRSGRKEFAVKRSSRFDDSLSSSTEASSNIDDHDSNGGFLKGKNSEWEFFAKGPLVMHREASSDGWLRIFDTNSGKESEFILRNHLFECKPVTYYEDRYMVTVFGVRLSQYKVEAYAIVSYVDTPDRISDGISEQEVLHITSLLGTRGAKELKHPGETPAMKSFFKLKSIMDKYANEGCLCAEQFPAATQLHLGIEVYDVLPRVNPLLLRVEGELPFAEPERIQGKASNQLNGLRFAHGLAIQTKDANQGGSLAESVKYPLVLRRFMTDEGVFDDSAPVIIGFRETVFTKHISTVGRFQAYAEWAFGTIVQRVMAKLGVRMHYGHPDFFSAPWVYSRSSLSKANPTYNLSEDIFAGYIAMLRNRVSTHTDRIQDEKGRDTSLASTYTFTAKIAQGAASQMKSRDIFELNSRLDFIRQFLTFQGSIGFYFSTSLMLLSVKMYLFGLLLFTIAGFSAENLGNMGLIFSVPFLLQVGNFNLVPLLLEAHAEEGFWAVLQVVFDFPLSLVYFLFQSQTVTYHFMESFLKGKSRYEATGRLLGVSRKSLIEMYQTYGRSHYEIAIDYTFYTIAYYIVADSRNGGYIPLIAPMMTILVFFMAPVMFQTTLSLKKVFAEVDGFGKWVFQSQTKDIMLKEWQRRSLSESIGRKLTGNAAYKLGFSRLQSYNVFNNLKTEINTHWRVDLSATVGNLVRLGLWGFISLSIPGTMKDIVMKVGLLFLFYFTYSAVFNMTLGSSNERKWQTMSLLMWLLVVALVIVQTVMLGLWEWFQFSIVGVFVSIKILNSFSWLCFHIYALFTKVHYSRVWENANEQRNSHRIEADVHAKKVESFRLGLEQNLLSGLFLLDKLERPFLMLGIFVFLLPIHIVTNLFWHIPGLSDRLVYGVWIKRDRKLQTIVTDGMVSGMRFRGFNMTTGSVDLDELDNENLPSVQDWDSF